MWQFKKIKIFTLAILSAAFIMQSKALVLGAIVLKDEALLKQMKIMVDEKPFELNAYNIRGNNYFKLRDLAWILSGTRKQFDLIWDENLSRVEILLGQQYALIKSEIEVLPIIQNSYSLQYLKLIIGGNETNISSANIDDLNYCKIRDFASMLDLQINYDSKTDSILLTTGYTEILLPQAIDYGLGQIEFFETKDLKGNTVTNEIFKEKPITFIYLWAAWFGPCKQELPDFKSIYEKYKDRVKFITIVDDAIENKSTADDLVNTYLSDYLNLLPASKLVDPISTGYVPTSVIVNMEGYLVIDKIIGAVGQYDAYLDEALSK